jgi:hypothetical protein
MGMQVPCGVDIEIEAGLSLLVGIIILNYIQNDSSFNKKLGILDGLNRIHDYKLNNILFGFGFVKVDLHIAVILGKYRILGIILLIAFFTGMYFYSDDMNALSFLCFTTLTPTQRFRGLQAAFSARVLAG